MNPKILTYDDCVLLADICLNSERISYLLEYRFKCNSNRTSFDFKSFLPEQPSNRTKISRSLLKFYPTVKNSMTNNNENLSSESSEDEIEEISSPKSPLNITDDDYLNQLAEWNPDKFQSIHESDQEEEEIRNDSHQINNYNIPPEPMDLPTGT
jgi:hypothetical protein